MSEQKLAPQHMQVGTDGERIAVEELQRRGFALIETNWRCQFGELDAVMRDGNELVFVEVKTRIGALRGSAEEAMSAAKLRKLAVAAEWYLAEHPELDDPIWRIDLVGITLDRNNNVVRFSHIPNAALVG